MALPNPISINILENAIDDVLDAPALRDKKASL
jgi:hypothetical protein